MPRSREISEELRKKVVEAHQSGKGYKLISKALGLSKTTVRAILHKWKKFGTVVNLPRSGRPPKISPKTRREILREVMKNPRTTAKDVQATLAAANISVHESTIRKFLGVHIRPTLTGFPDITSLRSSSDEEEGTNKASGKLSDSADGHRKDVKIENDKHDLEEQDNGCEGTLEGERCDESLGQNNEDSNGAGDASEKRYIDDDGADSYSSDDMLYKYDDDDYEDDDQEDEISYDKGCGGGDDYDGESCDEETEGDSTLQ